jgi:coenzyme F420-0:L-glutamate ligase / coenzyme F420-1:gamma-L-glutamate ligase
MTTSRFEVIGIPGIPMVRPGDNLVDLISTALADIGESLQDTDIVCVAQKIISKAEGRLVRLADVKPSAAAIELALETDKDPQLVELILSESDEVLRKKPGVLIVRHKRGFVMANAGVDQSNVDHAEGDQALLLPLDPDASAATLRRELKAKCGADVGVVITDSANRPWRLGTTSIAIGAAGITVLDDRRGETDVYGRELKVTMLNNADAIATAATMVLGETVEKIPVAIIRGLQVSGDGQNASIINRPLEDDLFR